MCQRNRQKKVGDIFFFFSHGDIYILYNLIPTVYRVVILIVYGKYMCVYICIMNSTPYNF